MQGRHATLTALLFAAAAGCTDAPLGSAPDPDDALLAQVAALGFRTDMVEVFEDYVLVEGDIYITKAELRSVRLPGGDPLGPRFQYYTNSLVGRPKINEIRVDLSGLASQPAWQTAAREALSHWSGITDSYVRMVEGTPADITMGTACTSSNVAAYASFPSGGNPGSTVHVNVCFGYSTTHAQKVHNMVHEFGHTIGFRHSNFTQMGETAGTVGANHVWGTPTSGNATGSVMNGGTALNSWAGFAASDLTSVRTLYALPGTAISVTDSGGNALVTWNAVPQATGYTVRLITYEYEQDAYGQSWYRGRYFTAVGSTTGTAMLDDLRSYTGSPSCTYPDPFDWSPQPRTLENWYEYEVVTTFPNGTSSSRVYAPVAEPNCGW